MFLKVKEEENEGEERGRGEEAAEEDGGNGGAAATPSTISFTLFKQIRPSHVVLMLSCPLRQPQGPGNLFF